MEILIDGQAPGMPRKDYRSEPVITMGVLGEINTSGIWAADPHHEGVQTLANKCDCPFVDLFIPIEVCTWLLANDRSHSNNVGHRVLGQFVFQVVATNCFLAVRKKPASSQKR